MRTRTLFTMLIITLPPSPSVAHAGIVNAELLSWMPRGGAVINGGRGGHLVEPDLLAALDAGQVCMKQLANDSACEVLSHLRSEPGRELAAALRPPPLAPPLRRSP